MSGIANLISTRIVAIAIAILTPFICYFVEGPKESLSSYWLTDLQPLFIFSNASTSYLLFSTRRWEISAFLLMMLTAFSVENYKEIHNMIAILFFLYNLYPMMKVNHAQEWILLYLAAFPVIPFGLFWAEVVAIIALCGFHSNLIYLAYKLNKKKDQLIN